MRTRPETCCFTGHRPGKLPWGRDETDPRCSELKMRIGDAVETAYAQGYRHFICGMAQGCDLYFCEIVLSMRQTWSGVTLEAAIPHPSQPGYWPQAEQARWRYLVDQCDIQTMVSRRYEPGCMLRRDRYMVDHASLLIAAFDGSRGGTRYTIGYAMRRGVEVVDIRAG